MEYTYLKENPSGKTALERGVQCASVNHVHNISGLGTAYSCNIPSRTYVIPLLQYTVRKKMLWE